MYNTPLLAAWLSTLNNRYLKENTKSSEEYEKQKCWNDNKGLLYWDAARDGPPKISADGIVEGVDVVCITSSSLSVRPDNCWVHKLQWHTIVSDEGHEFLRGQYNSPQDRLSLTRQNWRLLQNATKSMFLITGTPFVTKISYDFIAMTKAIAKSSVRENWGQEYTDEGLQELVKGWTTLMKNMSERDKEFQEGLREKVRTVLSTYMLRRDELSVIRGEKIMTDYFKLCTNYEDPIEYFDKGEIIQRERIFQEAFGGGIRLSQQRNDFMRCLSFCHRFGRWHKLKGLRSKAAMWEDYTLQEALSQARPHRLIEILQEGKKTGNGIVIFVQRTFLAEMALKVCLHHDNISYISRYVNLWG